jgi:hypothetical protein
MKVFVTSEQMEAIRRLTGTYNIGRLDGFKYYNLIEILGQPTFSMTSDEGKVQKEWVIEYDDNIFTVYDWKTYDEEFTMSELTSWRIGGFGNSSLNEFINFLNDEKTKDIH